MLEPSDLAPRSRRSGGADRVAVGLGERLGHLGDRSAALARSSGPARRHFRRRSGAGGCSRADLGAAPADRVPGCRLHPGNSLGDSRPRHPRGAEQAFFGPLLSRHLVKPGIGHIGDIAAAGERGDRRTRAQSGRPAVRGCCRRDGVRARRDGSKGRARRRAADGVSVLLLARPRGAGSGARLDPRHHQRATDLCPARTRVRSRRHGGRGKVFGRAPAADLVLCRRPDRRAPARRLGARTRRALSPAGRTRSKRARPGCRSIRTMLLFSSGSNSACPVRCCSRCWPLAPGSRSPAPVGRACWPQPPAAVWRPALSPLSPPTASGRNGGKGPCGSRCF